MEARIIFKGIELFVEGIYDKGEEQTLDYPGSAADFEAFIVRVAHSSVNIIDLLSEDDIESIEDLVLTKIN